MENSVTEAEKSAKTIAAEKDESRLVKPAADDFTDHLIALIKYYEHAENDTREARKLSERDRDYYHNDQWTSEELAILRARKQPALTINKIKGKVETMRGLERRMRTDPKAFPRNPNDEQGAEAATDALRFVADQNNFDEIRSLVYEDLIVPGYGGVDVTVEQTGNDDAKITVTQIPWERLGYDPHSIRPDFSDAKYKFIVIWMDKDDALEEYGNEAAVEDTLKTGYGDVYSDTPRDGMWCDSKRTRIRVVQMHYRWKDDWWIATFTKGGFLVDPVVSPYKDKDGKTACSLIMRALYIDRNGNRYGAVRDLISMQDEFNKRRSKALHLFNTRQTFGNRKALPDVQKAKSELVKPDGHIEVNADAVFGQDFGVIPTTDMATGNLTLLQQVGAELQATGANSALAGNDPRLQSGRAQQLQQQAGQVTLEPGMDSLRMFSRDVYEAIWMRVRAFWTGPKWVRVTDDERNLKWVGLNKPITVKDKLAQLEPQQAQEIAQMHGIQSPHDPRLQEVVEVENEVSGLDVDISIEEGPDIASLQSEQFETLAGLAKSGIPIPPKAIVQASSIRNKDAILDEMEKGGVPPQLQAQMAEMKEAIDKLKQENAEAGLKLADKADKAATDQYKADTDRLALASPAFGPAEIQALVIQTIQDAFGPVGPMGAPMGPPPDAGPMPPGPMGPPMNAGPSGPVPFGPQGPPPPGFSGAELPPG